MRISGYRREQLSIVCAVVCVPRWSVVGEFYGKYDNIIIFCKGILLRIGVHIVTAMMPTEIYVFIALFISCVWSRRQHWLRPAVDGMESSTGLYFSAALIWWRGMMKLRGGIFGVWHRWDHSFATGMKSTELPVSAWPWAGNVKVVRGGSFVACGPANITLMTANTTDGKDLWWVTLMKAFSLHSLWFLNDQNQSLRLLYCQFLLASLAVSNT